MYPGYNFLQNPQGPMGFLQGLQSMRRPMPQMGGQMNDGGQMTPGGGMSGAPMQPTGQFPAMGQMQPLAQPTGQLPPMGQPPQHSHGLLNGPLGKFAPLFGLGGMLAGTGALPYMVGGLGGGMLLSHLFNGHRG